MIIVIGEILIDRFPDYERIGGAPFNFAFHLKSLGWPVRFISRIGDDADGRTIAAMLETKGFDLADVQIDTAHATGKVDVTLDGQGVPQFDICENVAYDHIDLSSVANRGGKIDMIYFGTLAQRTDGGMAQVQDFLSRCASRATCFCDINLRAPHIREQAIGPSLGHADILKLNEGELDTISTLCNGPAGEAEAVDWLMRSYRISKLALTRGDAGSTFIDKDGAIDAPPAKTKEVVDTVGAGDAYAAVIAAGILNKLPLERTVEYATEFAARICGLPGAIPDNPTVYAELGSDFERIPNAQ